MPREGIKRGRRAKQRVKEVEIVKAEPLPKPRLPEPVAVTSEKVEEEAEWPVLDADTKAYFKSIDQQIVDLSSFGVGQDKRAGDELDENDDRALIIRGSLASLNGHEVAIATDPEASIILERLLYSMDDFAKRVLADRFVGQYAALARNRFASHVLQTLFFLGSYTVERETRGNIASGPSTSSVELRTMTELLTDACAELVPEAGQHLYDAHSTHLLRSALLLLTGSPFPTEREQDKMRSKSSRKFKGRQAPMKSLVEEEGKGKERERAVPESFVAVREQLLDALDVALGKGTEGALARKAGADPVSSVVVQMLVGFEADAGRSEEAGSLLDRLLEGLVSSVDLPSNGKLERKSFIDMLMRDATSSHLLEVILSRSPPPVLQALWSTYFVGRLENLSSHPVANFAVAKGIASLNAGAFAAAVTELAASKAPTDMLEKSRTGPLKALMERVSALGVDSSQVSALLQGGLGIDDQNAQYLVMALLTLSPYSSLSRHPAFLDFSAPPEPTLQGSLLAQAWLQMPAPANDAVVESLLSCPVSYLVSLCCNAIASRMVDAVFESATVAGKHKRRLILCLLKQYHVLADDRIGSRVADRCWDNADLFLKEKIAKSLLPHIVDLAGGKIGHFFSRKIQLPLYERKPIEWKQRMASFDAAPATARPAVESKKRESAPDEIDEIFSSSKKRRQ